MEKQYIVIHLTYSGDLYHKKFESLAKAKKFVEKNIEECKAVIVKGEFLEDHT